MVKNDLLQQNKGHVTFVTDSVQVEPLGIMYLSAMLKKAKHTTDLYCIPKDNNFSELENRIAVSSRPNILAYSVTTGRHKKFIDINNYLKNKYNNIFSVFGGPHPTFFPEMINEKGVDSICIGEGEEAFTEFMNTLFNGINIKVNNIYFKDGTKNKIYKNEIRPLCKDLDIYPFPDRDLIGEQQDGIYHVITSRGCPFDCSYCYNHVWREIYKNGSDPVRLRSPYKVVEEIKSLDQSKVSMIYFQDDIFGIRLSWLRVFADQYSETKIPFHCHLRPEYVSEDRIELLNNMGCHSITIGMETANCRIANHILNRKVTTDAVKKAVTLLKKYKIRYRLLSMIGLPTEDLEGALQTYSFAKKMKPTYSWCSIFQPYPKTKLGELSQRLGYFNGKINNFKENFFHDPSIFRDDRFTKLRCMFPIGNALRLPKWLVALLIRLPVYKPLKWVYQKHRDYVDRKLLVFKK
jgi:radical SAM superfamily enzyme YgiQ (UPF0313 family)